MSEGRVVVYRSNYWLPLSKWDAFMNKLWYYTAEKNNFLAKCVYSSLRFLEKVTYRFRKNEYE